MTADVSIVIQSRLALFESSGDPRCLIEPEASEALTSLRAMIGWAAFAPSPDATVIRRDLDAIVLAGIFAWERSRVLPSVDRLDALLQATELFAAAYPFAPESVPAQAAGVCAAISDCDGVAYVELHDDALDTLDAAVARSDRAAADQAICQIAAAVLAARGDPAEPLLLSSLGTAWMDRFKLTGRAADVDHAITAHERALAGPAPLPEDQAGHRANYSASLLARFELRGDMTDLKGALSAGRVAADLARKNHADLLAGRVDHTRGQAVLLALHTCLSNLAAALLSSWECCQERFDLDEAVQLSREAVDATAAGDPNDAVRRANLAHVLLERFARLLQPADLDKAFCAARAAVNGASRGDLAMAPCLSALALAYANRFAYIGELHDLDKAISVGRMAADAAPDGHPGQVRCIANLGSALHRRYESTGDTVALGEAIEMAERAVRATPFGPRRARYLNNLGNALRSRFDATGHPPDIRRSIAVLDEAVEKAGSRETDRPGYVVNLALSLVMAAEREAEPGTLSTAITLLEREAGTLREGHPLRNVCLLALGNALRMHFDTTGDKEALHSAITWCERAVDAVPEGHPRKAEHLTCLGAVLQREFERTGHARMGRHALAVSKSAAEIATAPAFTRALAARNWGYTAAALGDRREAVDGFATAVSLLDAVAWHGLRRVDQERQLGRFGALACDAAAWSVAAGNPERAVELLEQGRGVLLAQSLDERARHFDLQRADAGLAARLARIDRTLELFATSENASQADVGAVARKLADLAHERDSLLRRIRELPGFADFLKPPEFASLQQAAEKGPVVIVNISRYRCDALIVTTNGVEVAELPDLNGAEVVRKAAAFVGGLHELTAHGIGEETIISALAWAWDRIVLPILPHLRLAAALYGHSDAQRQQLWWCPTGPLTFLPLHAAGRHDRAGESVIESFISSYTPTLRLLKQARQQTWPDAHRAHPLLVALPATPGQHDLPAAHLEAEDFSKRFTEAVQLREAAATISATRTALTACPPWAHFACHGLQDMSDPSAGHLALHDGPLTIGDISGMRLHNTELAFLSACETSRGGAGLSDEAITIATAFCLAGYRHVIGTLWVISDDHAPGVARRVYDVLVPPGSRRIDADSTAAALDAAVLALRNDAHDEPSLWAPYVHIGP